MWARRARELLAMSAIGDGDSGVLLLVHRRTGHDHLRIGLPDHGDIRARHIRYAGWRARDQRGRQCSLN